MKTISTILAIVAGFAFSAQAATIPACSGGEGGGYDRAMAAINAQLKGGHSMTRTNMNGSEDIMTAFNAGDCLLAPTQKDALLKLAPTFPISMKSLFTEAGHYYYSLAQYDNNSDYADFGTLEDHKNVRVAVVHGSGGALMIENFIRTDEDYKHLPLYFDDEYFALDAASEGTYIDPMSGDEVIVVGYLAVHRPQTIPKALQEDFTNRLGMGEINDRSFKQAKYRDKPVYRDCEINSSLAESATYGKENTLCVDAVVVSNIQGLKKLDTKAFVELTKAINKAAKNAK
ncbi:hypothetical protein [Vibrio phage YC]|uniref:Uncharacterized protein n=1 Tax=Vibrio phage YC TaxID=2267403 RepID=A0A384ZSB7_9CAUD|nr:hypothetical protein HWB64_gp182 [Vibrio phage YC]AXC34551.1 hypothetical protein [Vibrio phage YC]